jgi:hypothetical protein
MFIRCSFHSHWELEGFERVDRKSYFFCCIFVVVVVVVVALGDGFGGMHSEYETIFVSSSCLSGWAIAGFVQ